MDKKKLLFIVGIIIIVILGIIAINMSKKAKTPKEVDELNTNVLKDTAIEGLQIADQSVITRDGLSTYMANVTNNDSETKYIANLYIVVTIADEEYEALAIKDSNIAAGSTLPITVVFDRDISKATKIEYKITND